MTTMRLVDPVASYNLPACPVVVLGKIRHKPLSVEVWVHFTRTLKYLEPSPELFNQWWRVSEQIDKPILC